MHQAPHKTIERLSMYRRLLHAAKAAGQTSVYSYNLAEMSGSTAAQVRRDLMEVGCNGNPKTGYNIDDLITQIGVFLDNPAGEPIALIGVGNLGRALLHFYAAHHPKLKIVAAFDTDPFKTGRVIHGCHCYDMGDVQNIIKEKNINLALLTVPAAAAQSVAEKLVAAGVSGLLNFAPKRLRLPSDVAVEDMDMTMALEKTAFLARQNRQHPKERNGEANS